ncbi:hypothetical protein GGR92_000179 [Spirosoma lacussanchae]|uniref:hypothetical protein n=1 Tax=Spirosoma lacussanchae TaxID=1884249 RepID=UPI00110963F9|nr:hypothetical protein [Spirosoma lacussanchae]
MLVQTHIQRSADTDSQPGGLASNEADNNERSTEAAPDQRHSTSSPTETPYTGSHADNYQPEQAATPDTPDEWPSGEHTKNHGERGGGLWTSGGQVTTGTPYHDEDEPENN